MSWDLCVFSLLPLLFNMLRQFCLVYSRWCWEPDGSQSVITVQRKQAAYITRKSLFLFESEGRRLLGRSSHFVLMCPYLSEIRCRSIQSLGLLPSSFSCVPSAEPTPPKKNLSTADPCRVLQTSLGEKQVSALAWTHP